jgi:RNA polymerase sigma-70 factor (ECF subfamily)
MRSTDRFSDVLDAARGGEEWAITALWRTYQPALLRYLRSSCGGAAEDVASEVWLSIGGKLSKFKGEEPEFRAWLFTLARRRTIDQHRRTARAPLPVAELPEAAIDQLDAEVERRQALDEALRLLERLSQDQREVLLLRVVAGLEVDQVAEMMGKRPGTVRVLHHRALKQLANCGVTPGTDRTVSQGEDAIAA